MTYVKSFKPIESDPYILTQLMHGLGVQENFGFGDVLDFKEESQQPALALIVIFPESQKEEETKEADEASRIPIIANHVKFLKQTIDNSCGLIAVLHCILNTVAVESIRHDSILYNAIRSAKGITTFLEESKELEDQYQSAAELGETEIPEDVKYHYIALVGCRDHNIYELDGERSSPLIKGYVSRPGYLLYDHAQMEQIIHSLTNGSINCSLYKLSQFE